MPENYNQWLDPKTILAIGGVAIGLCGFLFAIFTHRWSRRESRLDALSKILQPIVRCAQALFKANTCRRKIERMKVAYPDAKQSQEAAQRIDMLMEDYGEQMKLTDKDFREAEAEFASRHFRFPDSISKSIRTIQATLSELGRLVNDGIFDKADIQLAKFRDEYKQLTDTARGWRLADPLEGIRKRFRKPKTENDIRISEFDLTDKEMNGILELLHKRVTTQANNSFVVHPPKKIVESPHIIKSDNVIEELRSSVFTLVFQDGTVKMLSLPELMAFVFNLITFKLQTTEIEAMVRAAQPNVPREIQVSFQFSMHEIMKPEMVKALLEKVNFSDVPSD